MSDSKCAVDQTPSNVRQYLDVRDQLRDGDVILFDGARFMSKLIEKCSHGRYSHAGIVAWWGSRVMLLQAEIQCVQAVPLSVAIAEYDGRCDWWKLREDLRTSVTLDSVLGEAKADLGLPFGVFKLVREGLHAMIGIPAPTDDPSGVAPAMFCSEYVGRCFAKGGVRFVPGAEVPSPEVIAESQFFTYGATLAADPKLAKTTRRDSGPPSRPPSSAPHG
jgi:hypothetical protein